MQRLIVFVVSVMTIVNVSAQDVIVSRDAEEILSKIISVDPEFVSYKQWNNLDGPTYTIRKSDVFYIKYQNGEREIFQKISKKISLTPLKFQSYTCLGAIFTNIGGGPTLDANIGARVYEYLYVGIETGFHSLLSPYIYKKQISFPDYPNVDFHHTIRGVLFEGYIPLGVNLRGYITCNKVINPYINCSIGGFFGVADIYEEYKFFEMKCLNDNEYNMVKNAGFNGFNWQLGVGFDAQRFTFGIGYSEIVWSKQKVGCGYVKLGYRFGM
ncbi:MAG: hypothetical protein IKY57_06085 [Alistipes sp.]|nr:hypothetical protein [Alistipes sp.]